MGTNWFGGRARLGLWVAAIAVVVAGAIVAQEATAKVKITLTVSNGTPVVNEAVRITLTSDMLLRDARKAQMRVLALPPGTDLYAALRDENRYRLKLTRSGSTWRARTTFQRKGTWRLVVPNFGAPGYAVPPPIVLRVNVRPAG